MLGKAVKCTCSCSFSRTALQGNAAIHKKCMSAHKTTHYYSYQGLWRLVFFSNTLETEKGGTTSKIVIKTSKEESKLTMYRTITDIQWGRVRT